ncbi:deoxyribonuclease TATDN1 isoform X2 [Lycorma delicatula]|uniref:deoxyribonuclease TATDN1 isoform X2 n=2 Tax=Lycorma delicatula TaxID=130591 RepID=UPI003F50F6F9
MLLEVIFIYVLVPKYPMATMKKFIDIGANLNDMMYKGVYHGSVKHKPDLQDVLNRAWDTGLKKIIITAGSVEDINESLVLAQSDDRLYTTVGCHPTRCGEFEQKGDPNGYMQSLIDFVEKGKNKIVAIGECGLDYDRINFCPKEIQKKYFEKQLELSKRFNLPLFLHCRNAGDDLLEILKGHQSNLSGGVVHSFDGTWDLANEILNLGYHIGVNGCSLKTEENLSVVKKIPAERLMLETDCPWCEVRPSHAGYKYIKTFQKSVKKEKWQEGYAVKSRNEPANIIQVLEILCAIRNEDPQWLSEITFNNTEKLFFSRF